jgi:hypothetical protein
MTGLNKLSWRACWPVFPSVLAGMLLALWCAQRRDAPVSPPSPLTDWDIPRLVTYLNGEGLELRMVPTQKEGIIYQTAFLTTTTKEWEDLNHLPNDQREITQWQGTLYCQRNPRGDDRLYQTRLWGNACEVVGPFLLYGDRALLDRVRAALNALVPSGN